MKKLFFLLLLIAGLGSSAFAGVFYEYHSIYCGSILELGPVGYPMWNPATVVKAPSHGQVFIFSDQPYPDSLVYKSDYGYLGQDTFVVACAHATQITCDTGIYIISVIGCPPLYFFTEEHEINCDSTLLISGLGYPTWVIPEIIQEPTYGTADLFMDSTLWHTLEYTPEPGFFGLDTVMVECAHATQVTCETGIYIIHVSCVNEGEESFGSYDMRIFPNPATDVISIESDKAIERVKVLSMQGRVLRETTNTQITVGDLSAGLYLLEVWRAGQRVVSRVWVKSNY